MRFFLLCIFINLSLLSHPFSQADSLMVKEKSSLASLEESSGDVSLRESSLEEGVLTDSITDNARNSVWKIRSSSAYGSGTAFSIGPNLFITNFHVIAKALKNNKSVKDIILEQEFHSSQLTIKRIIRVSALYDLVLFETEKDVANHLNTAESLPQADDELFMFGYPNGKFQEVKKMGKLIDDAYHYTFPVNHSYLGGSSGSPVLDEQGQVIGIASEAHANMLFVIKSLDLKGLIAGDIGLNCSDFISLAICMKEAVESVKILAEQDSILAQHRLAMMYYEGNGTEKDFELAFYWFQRSVDTGGNALDQFLLGEMYHKGVGTKREFELALSWMQKSAFQGHVLAQYKLAIILLEGMEIEKHPDMAFFWMQKSAEQGYAPAQYILAMRYYMGDRAMQDPDLAFYWMQESAYRGYAPAQYHFGMMYYIGDIATKNDDLAFHWLKKSSDWDFVLAQQAFLGMYLRGEVIKDFELMFNLARRHAHRNDPIAQHVLALMYHRGEGTEKNPNLALIWFRMSANQGHVLSQEFLEDLSDENNEQLDVN